MLDRKHILSLTTDGSLKTWLEETLRQGPRTENEAEELTAILSDLEQGLAEAAVIRQKGRTHTPVFPEAAVIRAGALVIDPRKRTVTRDGAPLFLTPKEFDILWFLASNRGDVFTKEQIYRAVWEEDFLLSDSNIMAFIRKLRKKIEPAPDEPTYILTIWGIGYKFSDKV